MWDIIVIFATTHDVTVHETPSVVILRAIHFIGDAAPVFTTLSDGTEVESTMDDAGDAPFDIYVYDTIMDIFTPGGEWDPASFMRSIFVDTVQSFVGMIDGNEERIVERVDIDTTIDVSDSYMIGHWDRYKFSKNGIIHVKERGSLIIGNGFTIEADSTIITMD